LLKGGEYLKGQLKVLLREGREVTPRREFKREIRS